MKAYDSGTTAQRISAAEAFGRVTHEAGLT